MIRAGTSTRPNKPRLSLCLGWCLFLSLFFLFPGCGAHLAFVSCLLYTSDAADE